MITFQEVASAGCSKKNKCCSNWLNASLLHEFDRAWYFCYLGNVLNLSIGPVSYKEARAVIVVNKVIT